MAVVTSVAPSIRTRVNFTQSARGEWRVSEITIEVTDDPDPVARTSRLYHELRSQAERDVTNRNTTATLTNRPSRHEDE